MPYQPSKELLEKYGIKMAAEDDPIYSEPPSIIFINRAPVSKKGGVEPQGAQRGAEEEEEKEGES